MTATAKFKQIFLKKPNIPHPVALEELAIYTGRYSLIKTKCPSPIALPPCLRYGKWVTSIRDSCSVFCKDLSHVFGPSNTLVTKDFSLDFIPVFNVGWGKITAEIRASQVQSWVIPSFSDGAPCAQGSVSATMKLNRNGLKITSKVKISLFTLANILKVSRGMWAKQ